METEDNLGDLSVLPEEILIYIIELIPNRWNLSLVNWNFYEFICKIEANKYRLKLIDIDDDPDKYESIINSRRIFDEMKIMNLKSDENHVTGKLKTVLEMFQDSVRAMSIYNSKVTESCFIEMLNMHENLENLLIYDVSFSTTEKDSVELNLPNLKSLSIQLSNIIISRTILRVPKDTLCYLSIDNLILDPQTLKRILMKQRRIKELELDPYFIDPGLMKGLELTKLKLMSNRHVTSIIKNQLNLTSLDLSKAHISDADFLEICNLRNLKVLNLWIDRVSCDLLENLEKITSLQELSINYERLEVEYVAVLTKLSMRNLNLLKIVFPKLKIFSEVFIAISINCPNIKKLVINCQSIGVIGTIIESFKQLECLVFHCDFDSVKVVNFPVNNFINSHLRELYLYDDPFNNPAKEQFQSTATILSLINQTMPNLERLKIVNIISMDVDALNVIFSNKKNLTHIHVDDISVNVTIDENYIRLLSQVAHKIDYFELNKVLIDIGDEMITQIMDNKFSYVSCKKWKNEIILRNCTWNMQDDDNAT